VGVLLGFDFLGPSGIIIVAIIAVLLYGERLPEVARTFGKNFLELKKSIQGVREQLETAARDATASVRDATASVRQTMDITQEVGREEATAPKFEPPPSAPATDPHMGQTAAADMGPAPSAQPAPPSPAAQEIH